MNLSKDTAVIPPGAGSGTLSVIPGEYRVVLGWRVEEGGGFFSRVDLDALAMVANAHRVWVGACHKKDKKPFGGIIRHGGDKKARPGQMASETIYFNLAKAQENVNIEHMIFAITCYSNPLALANLAELSVQMFDPNNNPVLPGGLRGIKDPASAALVIYVNGTTGAYQEIGNLFSDVGNDAKQWRQLAEPATSLLLAA